MKRDATLLLSAAASGILATIIAYNFLKTAALPVVQVVTAAQDIAQNQTIGKEHAAILETKKRISLDNFFIQKADVIGKIAAEHIPKGTIIERSKVSLPAAQAAKQKEPDALPIPEGMRALTVSARNISQMPDLLQVGAYVDILGYVPNVDGEPEMRTIIQSALVLSITGLESGVIQSFAVALSAPEAEAAVKGMEDGKLRIVVRSDKGDKRFYEPVVATIEIIRGTNREKKITYGNGEA